MNIERRHLETVIKYYDATQRFYRRFWYGRGGLGLHYGFWHLGVSNRKEAIIEENSTLADFAHTKPGDLILDAGCGVGGSGIWLAQEKKAEVVGLNIVHKQLAEGTRLSRERSLLGSLHFVEGDYHYLPFRKETFDVFWSLESIEHALNIPAMLQEAFRVLKPSGRVVIVATFKGKDQLTNEEQRKIQVGLDVAGSFVDFRTAQEVTRIMSQVGLEDIDNIEVTASVMKSAHQMKAMCRWGLPLARVLAFLGWVSPLLVQNNRWGIYQEELFSSGATSYHLLSASKPR